MNKVNFLILALSVILLSGCDLINDSFTYKDKTKEFIETLLKEDYSQCVSLLAMNHESAKDTNMDTLIAGLKNFHEIIKNNFGNKPEFSFMKSEKRISSEESESTPPNTTVALIEISNEKEFGVLKVLFDDESKKIIHIQTLDILKPKPNMLIFFLSAVIPLLVFAFNIYVIRLVRMSTFSKKWLKYLSVMALNVPAISYSAVGHLSFKLLQFQLLFGVSFSAMGYADTAWTLGIPLGGLYWFWKTKIQKQQKNSETNTEAPDESLLDQHS